MPAYFKTSTDPRGKFHVAGCRYLGLKSVQVDLREVHRPQACRLCFPDAPRAESAHRFCPTCNTTSAQPCAHNGGVLVTMTRTRRKPSLMRPVGYTHPRREYVWPEFARHYA